MTMSELRPALRCNANALAKNVKREGRMLLDGLRPLYQPEPKTAFVIFAQGRTGSTLLQSLLNTHPDIYCDGEILSRVLQRRILFPRYRVSSRSRLAHTQGCSTYGFHLKIWQLHQQGCSDVRKFLESLSTSGYRIIYLRRENSARQVISGQIARRTVYHIGNNESPRRNNVRLELDPDKVVRRIAAVQDYHQQEAAALAEINHLALTYERHLLESENHQSTADLVFSYLGLQSAPVSTGLARTGSDNLSDRILNHEELERSLEAAGYGHFLS